MGIWWRRGTQCCHSNGHAGLRNIENDEEGAGSVGEPPHCPVDGKDPEI